jgi:hypothetical protein
MAWRGEAIANRAPNQAAGYDRHSRHLGVMEGSGMGANMSTSALGAGTGANTEGSAGWQPTVLYLFAFMLAEMVVFGIVAKLLQ